MSVNSGMNGEYKLEIVCRFSASGICLVQSVEEKGEASLPPLQFEELDLVAAPSRSRRDEAGQEWLYKFLSYLVTRTFDVEELLGVLLRGDGGSASIREVDPRLLQEIRLFMPELEVWPLLAHCWKYLHFLYGTNHSLLLRMWLGLAHFCECMSGLCVYV